MKALLITTLVTVFTLTGCNTVKGLGKDVSKAGEGIVNGAQKVEDQL